MKKTAIAILALFTVSCISNDTVKVLPVHVDHASLEATICPGGFLGVVPHGQSAPIGHFLTTVSDSGQEHTVIICDHD